jgi:chemotaxis protein MotA
VDFMFIAGITIAVLSIVVSTVMDGNSFAPLIGPSSFVLVLFGAVGTTIMQYQLSDVVKVPKAAIKGITSKPENSSDTITLLAKVAERARKDGFIALEGMLKEIEDPFVKVGLQLVIDGVDADDVSKVLETEMNAMNDRHRIAIGWLKAAGGYCPTYGMMGTVIGLINMLGNLSDPSSVGPSMSLALLTTLYGVMFANMAFTPLSNRLTRLHEAELAVQEVAVEGILAIRDGASPRLLVERLEAYLPLAERVGDKVRLGKVAAAPVEA